MKITLLACQVSVFRASSRKNPSPTSFTSSRRTRPSKKEVMHAPYIQAQFLLADSISVDFSNPGEAGTVCNLPGATALGILAFNGFTTITNSGSEVIDPKRNLGRAIVISIAA